RVFYFTLVLVILVVIFGAAFPATFEQLSENVKGFVATSFGWYYMLIMAGMLILAVILAVSPYGKIRLGKDHERPDFSTPTWIAMLFSAGMGIGLVFYGAAEPVFNYALDAASEKV